MAKTILRFEEEEYDFLLIGLLCQHKDYQLCHALNKTLELKLSRQDDYQLYTPRKMKPAEFPVYKYENNEYDVYYVFANRSKDDFLVPEQRQVDYFLMIVENFKRIVIQDLVNDIRQINMVLGAYAIDVNTLKSKQHFLF